MFFCHFFSYLIQIYDHHVDGKSLQRVLKDLSCELSLLHTGEQVVWVYTLVKLRLVVIDVNDFDRYGCNGAGMDPVDV